MLPTIHDVPRALRAPVFNPKLAARLAEFSRRAYSRSPCSESSSTWCLVESSSTTNARVLIEDIGIAIVVAFRGSQSIEDFIQDGKFLRRKYGFDGIEIHDGFLEDIESLISKITPHVREGGKPVLCTGHSLGADLAILGAWLLTKANLTVRAVYANAPARPGNAAFKRAYNYILGSRTFCIVNSCDPVPWLPPWVFGNRHVGQKVFLPLKGGYKINPPLGVEWHLDMLKILFSWRKGKLAFLPNHEVEKYVHLLNQLEVIA